MTENLKVSIQLNLDLPMRYTESGERLSPIALAAPYIDRLMRDITYEGSVKTEVDFPDHYYDSIVPLAEGDMEAIRAMNKATRDEAKRKTDMMLHEMWMAGQESLCQSLYGISWDEFRNLDEDARAALCLTKEVDRKLHNTLKVDSPYAI